MARNQSGAAPRRRAPPTRSSPDRFRAVLNVLMTVVVMPVGGSTGRAFDPNRVRVTWR